MAFCDKEEEKLRKKLRVEETFFGLLQIFFREAVKPILKSSQKKSLLRGSHKKLKKKNGGGGGGNC